MARKLSVPGGSLGGARPKASAEQLWIAKFPLAINIMTCPHCQAAMRSPPSRPRRTISGRSLAPSRGHDRRRRRSGQTVCWGANSLSAAGALRTGDVENRPVPTPVVCMLYFPLSDETSTLPIAASDTRATTPTFSISLRA
jgi:hypothetical protein